MNLHERKGSRRCGFKSTCFGGGSLDDHERKIKLRLELGIGKMGRCAYGLSEG